MGNVESDDEAAGQVKHVGAPLRRAVLFRQVLVASVFAIVSVVSDTELGHGFWSVESMAIDVIMLGSFAVFLVMLAVHLANKRWIAARGYGLLIVAFAVSMRVSGHVNRHHERTAKQAAEPILEALEAYRADAGRYPDELDELVPRYLKLVGRAPVAFIRTLPYGYHPSGDGASYYISFPKPHGYWHSFDSEAGQWGMHD